MRKEATLEEWKELYEIAIKLKDMEPWEALWDMDLITIIEEDKEPCICSIMGRGGECFGIGVYRGAKDIHDFFVMADSYDVPGSQLIRYQNNIMCNFGSREELTNKERKIIKDLGLSFRGKNNWIYFRTFESGYAPFMPNREEVLEATSILQHLYMALLSLVEGVTVDFEAGNTLMRMFDKKQGLWLNFEAPMIMPKVEYQVPFIQDELLKRKLKKQAKTKIVLEMDIVYTNATVKEKAFDKPIIPRICVLLDMTQGLIIDNHMIIPDEAEMETIMNMLINYVLQRGIPKSIVVRDNYMKSIIESLSQELGFEITVSGSMDGVDGFIESMYQHGF